MYKRCFDFYKSVLNKIVRKNKSVLENIETNYYNHLLKFFLRLIYKVLN